MARAKKLAAAQQKKHSGDKAKKSGVEAEVATLRRQLAAVRTKLARALHPAGGQMLGFNRKKEKQQYSATDLPEAVGVDKVMISLENGRDDGCFDLTNCVQRISLAAFFSSGLLPCCEL